MNEESHLLPTGTADAEHDRVVSRHETRNWTMAVKSFFVGVAATLLVTTYLSSGRTAATTTATPTASTNGVPLLGKKHSKSGGGPPLHYFAKASTDFASTLPPLPPNVDDSFLADLVTRYESHGKDSFFRRVFWLTLFDSCTFTHSTDKKAPITSGFYRQEAGEVLVYTYTYHEMKIIVAGEFHISDDQGNAVVATAGDVFYFPKGSTITFSSPSFGLGFFCGQRGTGEA